MLMQVSRSLFVCHGFTDYKYLVKLRKVTCRPYLTEPSVIIFLTPTYAVYLPHRTLSLIFRVLCSWTDTGCMHALLLFANR